MEAESQPKSGPGGGTDRLLTVALAPRSRQSNTAHSLTFIPWLRCRCFIKLLVFPPLDATALWQILHRAMVSLTLEKWAHTFERLSLTGDMFKRVYSEKTSATSSPVDAVVKEKKSITVSLVQNLNGTLVPT